jgi:2,3-bisphosphoglycerate-independent phosphoglycerate mutase
MSIFDFFKKPAVSNIKPVVLVVYDGWGIAPDSEGNAIARAKTPSMKEFASLYPHGELIASGESVGLPANEVGNSEVGHLTIGVGRTIYQSLVRINNSIVDGTYYRNEAFLSALNHIRKTGGKLHIMGLASQGNVHSALPHLMALIEFCKRGELKNVSFHLFTDGRDAPPTTGREVISTVHARLGETGVGRIATISGRYYALDRDARWDRTQKAYEAIVSGMGTAFSDPVVAVDEAYKSGNTDEFVPPSVILGTDGKPSVVSDNDAVIFFNFRVDRPRQLTMSFVLPDFEHLDDFEWGYHHDEGKVNTKAASGPTFKRSKVPQNLFFVTMTEYQKKLPVSAVAFPNNPIDHGLAQIFSESGMNQIHISESEKERMITYYFDGLREAKFDNEDVVVVPSPKVPTYDKKPEMNAWGIVKEVKRALSKSKYHFVMLNFANPDMVGHTGNLEATIKACEVVDGAIGEIAKEVLARDGVLLITADHGNAEELLAYDTLSYFFTTRDGTTETGHSNNPVPFFIISNQLKNKNITLPQGKLADVAPTILDILNIAKPDIMTGKSLYPRK